MPPMALLLQMSCEELSKLRITQVLHASDGMSRVSFGFSNGVVSPKQGTYEFDADVYSEVPDKATKQINFASYGD